jgi:acetyl esterase
VVLHPQSVAAERLWSGGPSVADGDVDIAARRAEERALALTEPKDHVETVIDIDADGVGCRLYRPSSGAPVIIHLHGGGFVFGDLETHDAHCRRLAVSSGSAVLAVDYRRAPDHTYPAASDDVDTVVGWLGRSNKALDVDRTRVSVVGDSAGGQLALVAALRQPAAFESVALVYPCLDPDGAYPSYRTEEGGLTAAEMSWFWSSYLGPSRTAERADPPGIAESSGVGERTGAFELTPLSADLGRLPRTLVMTAEHDPLRDEGEALAAAIAAAGVSCVATRYLGMIHGFFRHPDLFDASAVAMHQVAAWLRSGGST